MENLISLDNKKIKNYIDIDIDKDIDFEENRNRKQYTNIIKTVIDSGTNYIIKGLPLNENIKNIALDIKSAFKTKDFNEVLKTAVNSTIREGLEVLNLPKNVIKDIAKISKIAFKGGLSEAISAGIDIVANKYLKNNIFSSTINKFLTNIKNYVYSIDFKNKVDSRVNKLLDKTKKFKELCDSWYNSYEKFDIFSMNNLCKIIKKMQPNIVNDKDCLTQTNIIDNMTKLINSKKGKLSQSEMQMCSNI